MDSVPKQAEPQHYAQEPPAAGESLPSIGPPVYMNWLAAIRGEPVIETAEYPLYSDTCFTGQVSHGPYHFLNTIPMGGSGLVQVPVILRFDQHWKFPSSDMTKSDTERYHGGSPAEEVAALASLALGARLKAGNACREFWPGSDPKGLPREWNNSSVKEIFLGRPDRGFVVPRAGKRYLSLEGLQPLAALPRLQAAAATALVRSARQYQEALWLAESETAMSWLLLVSAIETAGNSWRKDREPTVDRLESSIPELHEYLTALGIDVLRTVADSIGDMLGSTKKFVDFLIAFQSGPPESRPPVGLQHPWGKDELKRSFRKIYKYRSKALHEGIPFPYPMCEPPSTAWSPIPSEVPNGLATSALNATWVHGETPMHFHVFEHIARNALLNWWRLGAPESASVEATEGKGVA